MAKPKPRLRERLAVGVFVLLFVIPVLLRSTVVQGPLPCSPALLTKLHNIACLFTHKPNAWNSYYVQIQRGDLPVWITLDQSELFPLQPFGRRTRMHRLLIAWDSRPGPRTEDMARWILTHHAALHPDEPAPVALRFCRAWTIPSVDEPPQRGWEHPDFFTVPPAQRQIIATYTVAELFPDGSEVR